MPRKKKPRRNQPPIDYVRTLTLPPISVASLRRYHRRLSDHLSFPCAAFMGTEESGTEETFPVLALGLRPVEEANLHHGLLVEIALGEEKRILPLHEIDLLQTDLAAEEVLEYLLWIDPALGEEEAASGEEALFEPDNDERKDALWTLLHLAVYCAGMGVAAGAILKVVQESKIGAMVGAAIVGLLGLLLGCLYAGIAAPDSPLALRRAVFGFLGAMVGVLAGALAGVVIVAYVGAIPGAIAGTLLGRWRRRADPAAPITWSIAGAFLGGLGFALYLDKDAALAGAGVGLLVSLGCGMLFLSLVVAGGMLYLSRRGGG